MTAAVIIDIVVALILVFFTVNGVKRGLLQSAAGLVILVAALIGASLITSALTEQDEQVRIDDYKRCQEILAEQAAAVFICDPNLVVACRKDLKGYTFYPVTFHDMSKLYYEG